MSSIIDKQRLLLCRQAAQIRNADPGSALELFRQALLQEGGCRLTSAIHRHIANILAEQGDLNEAEEHLAKSIVLTPKSELASVELFHLLEGQMRYAAALDEIRRFISLGDSVTYRELLSEGFKNEVSSRLRDKADLLRAKLEEYALGRVEAALGRYEERPATDEALEALAMEVLGFGSSSIPADSVTDDWTNTGSMFREAGVVLCKAQARIAIVCLSRSTILNPADLRSWLWLCQAYRNDRDTIAAEAALQSALLNCSDKQRCMRTLGWFYSVYNQQDKAVRVFRDVVENDPNDMSSMEMLADSLQEIGALAEGYDLIKQCLMIEETSTRQSILGDISKKMGKLAESNAAYQRALELDPAEESATLGLERFFKG